MEPTKQHNLDGYGTPPIAWDRVRDVLTADVTQVRGMTHVLTIIGRIAARDARRIVQVDGIWYFNSGPRTRKSRNIAADPRCVVSVATDPIDLFIEGSASRVTDTAGLQSVAAAFVEQGWPAQVEGDALTAEYSVPSAGPPPWHAYRVTPATVFAFGTAEPYGATKFDLKR